MSSRRVATTLALAVLAALGACSKEAGNNSQAKSSVGARIDSAIDRTQEKLSTAGEKAKEDLQQATAKTQEALSKAGDRISAGAANAVSEAKQSLQSPPYSPRQPGPPPAAAAADPHAGAAPSTPASITTALTTGPSTEIKITPAPDAPR